MRVALLTVAAAAAVTAAAPPRASAAWALRPPVVWLRGEGNYTKASRTPRSIDRIVVHVTEGPFWGSVTWLRSRRAHASAHFVVSRRGRIVQLVHLSDIAWHAGNPRWNRRSVGIEHEGETFGPDGFTRAQYVASARLAAWIARRSLMPIDRAHIVGHDEVPDPRRPWLLGGRDRHADPGPRWRWRYYLSLVRRFALAGTPLQVSSTLRAGPVSGIVPWAALTGKAVTRVDFAVDGRLLWSDRSAPFSFLRGRGLNSVGLENGRHVLELRAFGTGGRTRTVRVPVLVRNRRFALTTAGARPWTVARGLVRLRARVWAARAEAVSLRADGRRLALDRRPPYVFSWDARRARPGRHVLLLTARAVDGRVVRRRIPVVVNPPPRVAIRGQSLGQGRNVQGLVVWRVDAVRASQVEFLVDGVVRGTDVARPYTFGWDTSAETPGPHVLAARAAGRDGGRAAVTVRVTVAPPQG